MPFFRPKEFVQPSSIDDALALLREKGGRARVLAGGTAIYELATRQMIPEVESLIDIQKLPLDYLKMEADGLHIGATSTLEELRQNETLKKPQFAALADSLNQIRPIQVRNIATIGGEICSGLPFLDLPPTLQALGANVKAIELGGERVISLDSFWVDYFLTRLKRSEMISEVIIASDTYNISGSSFMKLGRTIEDFALVNVATSLALDRSGTLRSVRISIGGISKTPVRLVKAENTLIGVEADEAALANAVKYVDELKPTPSIHASTEYKKEITRVLVQDSLRKSLERASQKS